MMMLEALLKLQEGRQDTHYAYREPKNGKGKKDGNYIVKMSAFAGDEACIKRGDGEDFRISIGDLKSDSWELYEFPKPDTTLEDLEKENYQLRAKLRCFQDALKDI